MMKSFWKDYAHLLAENGRFYKKHWVGCVLIYIASAAATYAYICRYDIKDKLEIKFHKD